MISIKPKKLTCLRKNDIAESLTVETYNAAVDMFAKELRKELKDKSCDIHPNNI